MLTNQVAIAIRTDLVAFLAKRADGWRLDHKFSNGTPDNYQGRCFLLKLIRHGRIEIRQPSDAYVRFSEAEYAEHLQWLFENEDSIDGVESGVRIVFKSKLRQAGDVGCDSYASFLADRWDSSQGADAVGQLWVRDVEAYNE